MSEPPQRYLIAYDITDDRRRDKVSKLLQSHGVRVQHSVFLVNARPARIRRLITALEGLLILSEDSLLACSLGDARSADSHELYVAGANPLPTFTASRVL